CAMKHTCGCYFTYFCSIHQLPISRSSFSFFFNHPSTTEIYTLSLHDALPISFDPFHFIDKSLDHAIAPRQTASISHSLRIISQRSEEHTSELQSRRDLVCRLLLEKKNCVRMARKRSFWRARKVSRGTLARWIA